MSMPVALPHRSFPDLCEQTACLIWHHRSSYTDGLEACSGCQVRNEVKCDMPTRRRESCLPHTLQSSTSAVRTVMSCYQC